MYFVTKDGVGPFKRKYLAKQQGSKIIKLKNFKNGDTISLDGINPVSTAKITFSADASDNYVIFENEREFSVRAKSFEAYPYGYVFTALQNLKGYVAQNGNIFNPVQDNKNTMEAEVITNITINDKVMVYEKAIQGVIGFFYTVADATTGLEILPDQYANFSFGDKKTGLPNKVLILKNKDGLQTIVNSNFTILGDKVKKYQTAGDTLYILSETQNNANGHKSILEAFPMSRILDANPTLKFMEYDVEDFDATDKNLITYKNDSTQIYQVAQSAITPGFSIPGIVKRISPLDKPGIYFQTANGKNALITETGEKIKNPDLNGLQTIKSKKGLPYIAEVKKQDGSIKQGMFNTQDMSTIVYPNFHKIAFLRTNKQESDKQDDKALFVATVGDTFLVGQIEKTENGSCPPPKILIKPNNYFKPQLTPDDDKTIIAEDSNGQTEIISFYKQEKTGDYSYTTNDEVRYSSEKAGYDFPKPDVQFVEE